MLKLPGGRRALAKPELEGGAHAWIGILLGGAVVLHILMAVLILVA